MKDFCRHVTCRHAMWAILAGTGDVEDAASAVSPLEPAG